MEMRFACYLIALLVLTSPLARADVIPIVGETTINTVEVFEDDTIILENPETGETNLYIGNGPGQTGQVDLINSSITADTSVVPPRILL